MKHSWFVGQHSINGITKKIENESLKMRLQPGSKTPEIYIYIYIYNWIKCNSKYHLIKHIYGKNKNYETNVNTLLKS